MAAVTAVVAGIGGLVSAGTGVAGSIRAGKSAKEAKRQARAQAREIARLEASRQDVPDFAKDIKDLSSTITNPMQNLQVATGAAEMQAEQTDIALAQTLDQLRTTGAGAGGATALSQAALQSKQGIAANIQQQEASNARLRAEGRQAMQRAQLQEAQRVQGAKAAAGQAKFNIEEGRLNQQLERAAGLQDRAAMQEQQAIAQQAQAIGQIGAGLVTAGTQAAAAGTSAGSYAKKMTPSLGLSSTNLVLGGGSTSSPIMSDYSTFGSQFSTSAVNTNITGNPFSSFTTP